MYPNPPNDKGASGDNSDTWGLRYSQASGSQEQLFEKFEEWYKMMYAVRDDKNTAKWRSKVHIPLVSTKAWNLISKFIQQEPGFEVTVRRDPNEIDPADEQLEAIAEKVQRKMEADYHNPELSEPMRDKINSCLIDAVVTGTGLAKVPWVVKNKVTYSHPVKDGVVDYDHQIETEELLGYNDFQPVNIFDVFIAPSAISLQDSPWVMIKSYKTLQELKDVNEAAGAAVYKNLDSLQGAKAHADDFAVQKKARQNLTSDQDPVVDDKTVDLLEVFECYERDSREICTYVRSSAPGQSGKNATAWTLIREQKNPYWHGKYPLVPFYIRRRPFSFWGESIFETTQRLQSAANDIFNHYLDSWSLAVDGGIMIEETAQVNDFLVEPGFELVYRGEQPKQFTFPSPDPNQLAIVMNKISEALENATISNYATGTPVSGVDKTQGTARGVLAMIQAASDIVVFMRDNFSQSIKSVGDLWLSNNRQFMDFDVQVPIMKDNKVETQTLTPEEMQLDMQLRVDDMSMQPLSEDQKRQNFMAYQNNLIQLQTGSVNQAKITGDPNQVLFLDYPALGEQSAKYFGQRDFRKVTMTNEAAMANQNQQAQAAAQAQTAMAQTQDTVHQATIDTASLPGEDRIKAAEDALIGLQPQGTSPSPISP
jgi:hypothetical protein